MQRTVSIAHCPQCETDLKIVEKRSINVAKWRKGVKCEWIQPKYIKTKPKATYCRVTIKVCIVYWNKQQTHAELICFF